MGSNNPMDDIRYTRTAIVLHWVVALLMIGNVALALTVDFLPDDWVRPAIDTHKSIGITVLGLVLFRVLWRMGHRAPDLPVAYPAWQRRASNWGHGLLYVLMLALPLSGWLHDSAWKDAATHPMYLFGLFEWPRLPFFAGLTVAAKDHWHEALGNLHTALSYGLYVLLAVHIAAAAKHQWIDRERELQRMWFR